MLRPDKRPGFTLKPCPSPTRQHMPEASDHASGPVAANNGFLNRHYGSGPVSKDFNHGMKVVIVLKIENARYAVVE